MVPAEWKQETKGSVLVGGMVVRGGGAAQKAEKSSDWKAEGSGLASVHTGIPSGPQAQTCCACSHPAEIPQVLLEACVESHYVKTLTLIMHAPAHPFALQWNVLCFPLWVAGLSFRALFAVITFTLKLAVQLIMLPVRLATTTAREGKARELQ